MQKTLSLQFVVFFLGWALAGNSGSLEELRVPREISSQRVLQAPVLDGIVQANPWKDLPWSSHFTMLDSLWQPAEAASRVALAYDAEYLYVAMQMSHTDAGLLRGREKFSMWSNDVAEFFIWKKGQPSAWYHLGVDCSGKVYWAREEQVPEMPGTSRGTELPVEGLKTGVQIADSFWSVTAAIPLASLQDFFAEGSRVNFGRGQRVPYCFSSWARTDRYQNIENAGIVRLDSPVEVERKQRTYAAALETFQIERQKLVESFKKRDYVFSHAFSAGDHLPAYQPLPVPYSAAKGYGWLDMEGIQAGSLDDAMQRNPSYRERFARKSFGVLADHYIYAETPLQEGRVQHTFRVDLPNGKYKVHLLSGLITRELERQRRCFTVSAQGQEIQTFDVGHELFLRYDFPVTVQDNKLLLTFTGLALPAERKESFPLSTGDIARVYVPGWLLNSLVVYPAAERRPAEKQLASDELEITHCAPEQLVKYQLVTYSDPEPAAYPESSRQNGYVLFTRPLGALVYPESRPRPEEIVQELGLRAVAGEPVILPFAFLPLRDLDGVVLEVEKLPLALEETRYVSKELGGGKYTMAPLFNDKFENCSPDFTEKQCRWFWLTGRVPEDAEAGVWSGQLLVKSEDRIQRFPIRIEVLPFKVKRADFAFGGINPLGYNRPGCIYEDQLAALCARYELHAQGFYVDPFKGESSWQQLEQRVQLYQKKGVLGPFAVYVYLPVEKVDIPLRNHQIQQIPEDVMEVMLEAAGRLHRMHLDKGFPELIFSAMDEAHCKGDPYWSEQIRLFKAVKEKFPALKTSSTESDRSMPRIRAYLDAPNVFEVDDLNLYKGFPRLITYTNQYLLELNDLNCGRFQCGWIPAVTPVKAVMPWLLFEGTGESGFHYSIWTMIQQRGIGGYHYMPKLVTMLGSSGIWDLNYVETLRELIDLAKKSGSASRLAAAAESEELLQEIQESIKPSIKYYYHNGYWKPEVFCRLRELLIEQILILSKGAERK